MEEYEWKEKYNAIILRYSVGYLDDEELVIFLRKARNALDNSKGLITRNQRPTSFIFIQDNVVQSKREEKVENNERVRCYANYDKIFEKAGLKQRYSATQDMTKLDLDNIGLWVLY